MIGDAVREVEKADRFVIIGTSLQVYPAASLIEYVKRETPVVLIDPNETALGYSRRVTFIRENATTGVAQLHSMLTAPE